VGNPFVYVQLQTSELDEAQRFYGELFDWQFDRRDTPAGPYVEIRVGEGTAGGIAPVLPAGAPPRWNAYVEVTDIDRETERARRLGARILQPPTQLPDGSWFSHAEDPAGTPFGMHQSPSRAKST
jgi:uncharacterized protein